MLWPYFAKQFIMKDYINGNFAADKDKWLIGGIVGVNNEVQNY